MATLKVQLAGKTHELPYDPGEALLVCALRHNVDAPYSCLEGVCKTCLGKVKAGEVDTPEESFLTPEQVREGCVLTCQSKIRNGCQYVEIDYDDL